MTTASTCLPSAVAALLLASLAFPAAADSVTLDRPGAAGSLHDGALDMVAYYLPAPDGRFELTATFAPKVGEDAPAVADAAPVRMVMALADGDAVSFGVPGHPRILYGFARSGDRVMLSVGPVAPSVRPAPAGQSAAAPWAVSPTRLGRGDADPVRLILAAGKRQGCPAQYPPRQKSRSGCK